MADHLTADCRSLVLHFTSSQAPKRICLPNSPACVHTHVTTDTLVPHSLQRRKRRRGRGLSFAFLPLLLLFCHVAPNTDEKERERERASKVVATCKGCASSLSLSLSNPQRTRKKKKTKQLIEMSKQNVENVEHKKRHN